MASKNRTDSESEDEREKNDSDDEGGIRARVRNKKRDLETSVDTDAVAVKETGEGEVQLINNDEKVDINEVSPVDEEEVKRRAKRAERFGDQITQPEPEVVKEPPPVYKYTQGIDPSLPWSERKRLMVMQKGNNKWGDQTYIAPVLQAGFNPLDEKEKLKAKKRLERFHENMTEKLEEVETEENKEKRSERFGIVPDSKKDHLKLFDVLKVLRLEPEQVYRNDEFRKDPPMISQQAEVSTTVAGGGGVEGEGGEGDGGATKNVVLSEVGICRTKLHLFALRVDKNVFTQFRSPDLIQYLKAYNPTYVEWLNNRSCNVHFADEFTACRAFQHFFKELPPFDMVVERVKQKEAQYEEKKMKKNQMLSSMNSVLNKAIIAANTARTKAEQKAKADVAAAGTVETAAATEAEAETETAVADGEEREKSESPKIEKGEEDSKEEADEKGEDPVDKDDADKKDDEKEETEPTDKPVVESKEATGDGDSEDNKKDQIDKSPDVNEDEEKNKLEEDVTEKAEGETNNEGEGGDSPVILPARSRTEDFTDLGQMNWRLGPPLTTKSGGHKGGGISCRMICRFAYDFDVLVEKPKVQIPSHKFKGKGKGKGKGGNESKKRKADLDGALPSYRSKSSSTIDDVSNIKIKSMKKSE